MWKRWIALLLVTAHPGWAQIELPEDLVEPDPEPEAPAPEPEVDEEAIRTMTRQIQSRTRAAPPPERSVTHPAEALYQRVAARLQAAPEQVRLRVRLENGRFQSGVVENRVLDVITPLGTFPVLWSEMETVARDGTDFVLTLRGGDRISGDLRLPRLHLERDDASLYVLLPEEWRDISVQNLP